MPLNVTRPVLRLTLATFLWPELVGPLDVTNIDETPLLTLQAAPQSRDQPAHGTASISGRLVRADTMTPLAEVRILVVSVDGRAARASVQTDRDGRYRVDGLAAGRYRIQAVKAGYVTLEHGQRRAFEDGTVIELGEGQTLSRVDLAMPRGGVITGHVYDRFGEPATGAFVQALRYQFSDSGWELVAVTRTTADDRGAFRLFGLPPAEYYTEASTPAWVGEGTRVVNAPTYYPGTADVAAAQRIVVGLAQQETEVTADS